MNLDRLEYWPGILLAFIVFVMVTIILEKKFFRMVKTYWFFNRSSLNYISSAFFILGMGLLLFALLDIRGPEEKIKTDIPADRTIILLDTSASMLAEDVKPSRLMKAVLVAKHFARKAAGHQISVVAFAEIQKKIVPFTNDIDLIDARLESLKNLRNQYGSSALTLALQESIQYFKETSDSVQGNILVLTDGEETAEGIDLNIPKEIRVAFVGIGTSQGGRIPMDDSRGFRFGYKKDKGRDVITKLNENFFKSVVSDIPSSKYWLTNSYSLPTDEILDFFISEKTKSLNQQDMTVKPVLMEWIVVPAIILMILSYFLKAIRVFTLGMLLVISPGWGNEKEVELPKELIEKMEQLQSNKLGKLERLKLADELYKAGLKPEAMTLYDENIDPNNVDKSLPPEAYFNYGTGLLEQGETRNGLKTYENLLDSLKGDPDKEKEIAKMAEKNIVTHFYQQEQKAQQDKEKKEKEKNQEQNKDQNKDQQGGQGENSQDNQSGQGQDQNKNQSQGNQDKQDQNKDQGKKDKSEQDKKKGEDQDKDKKKDDGENKEDEDKEDKNEDGEGEKPMPPKKLPAKLKQLMSDDRQLQMKVIENGTRDLNKRKSRRSKDW